MMPTIAPNTTPSRIACAPACAAASGSFADAPRHRRRRADRQADRRGVEDRHQRLGDADGGDGVGAQLADEEHVDHQEHRLHHHLEHHRHREQHDGAADGRFGVVLMRSADRFAQRRPDRVTRRATRRGFRLQAEVRPSFPPGRACFDGTRGVARPLGPGADMQPCAGKPACSIASRFWQAVTPEPQYITVSPGGRPDNRRSKFARSVSGGSIVPSAARFCARNDWPHPGCARRRDRSFRTVLRIARARASISSVSPPRSARRLRRFPRDSVASVLV